MKSIFSTLTAFALVTTVIFPNLASADWASGTGVSSAAELQAREDFYNRKIAEYDQREADLNLIRGAFERATEARDAGRVTVVIGLLGSSLATSSAVKIWGSSRDTLCKAGLKCQAIVAGLIMADVVMIAGGAISVTVTSAERSQILHNLKTQQSDLARLRAALQASY